MKIFALILLFLMFGTELVKMKSIYKNDDKQISIMR